MTITEEKIVEESEEDAVKKEKSKKDSKKKKKAKKDKKKLKKNNNKEHDPPVLEHAAEKDDASVQDDSSPTESIPIEEESCGALDETAEKQIDKIKGTSQDDDEQNFDEAGDECKIFLSRIPAAFDEGSVTRSLTEAFGADSVQDVALTEVKNEDTNDVPEHFDSKRKVESKSKEHRGFAFVTMSSVEFRNKAVEMGIIKGKVKETSKKKHTIYIRPIVRNDEAMDDDRLEANICFLWSKFRCPYGEDCKFKHVGEGSCIEKKEPNQDKRSAQKCFSFRTKGKCKLGDKCPYRHDFEPPSKTCTVIKKEAKDKDCINWKTKGKCRKGDKCPYRHDDLVMQAFLEKKQKKTDKKRKIDKVSQPLSVRVFGLNYDTTEEDIREYFKQCGKISEITFPTFEDSGRSKGYCGVLFVSPKATEKACELDGQELQGRWLSIQPGKMYLRQWEEREKQRGQGNVEESIPAVEEVGEFGQKVKKRKSHGFKNQ